MGNNGKFSVQKRLYDFYPVTSRNHCQTVGRWLYHVRGDRQLLSNVSITSCESAIGNPKCECGVIFLWLLKRKNTTNFKVKSQNASFKQLWSSQKMWIKKRFLCELSQHQGAVNLFYTLRGFLTATTAILISPLTEASVDSPDMM